MAEYIDLSGKKHQSVKRWTKYKDGKTSARMCPRCGPGTLLAAHKDRVACGKCGYAEMQVKK